MGERINWKIPKTCASRERSNQASAVEEVAVLNQVGQVVSPGTITICPVKDLLWWIVGAVFLLPSFGATSPLLSYLSASPSQPFLSEAEVVLFSSPLGNSKWM